MWHSSIIRWIVFTLPVLAGTLLAGAHYWPSDSKGIVDPGRVGTGESLETSARSVLSVYCATCHTSGRSGADFDEASLQINVMRRNRALWGSAVQKLRSGSMPPRRFPQPVDEDRRDLIRWIEEAILCDSSDDEGLIMARRLLRSEYHFAIQDLFGNAFEPAADLPHDDDGWDRYGSLPALAVPMREQYRAAAKTMLAQALAAESACTDPSSCDAGEPAPAPQLFMGDSMEQTEAERARDLLAGFARRAFRRPIGAAELGELAATFANAIDDGGSFADGMRDALTDILTSPHFLFRIETHPDADLGPAPTRNAALASRLSFFVWRRPPDDELLAQAEKGFTADSLARQASRLLRDPRSQALVSDLADRWLSLAKFNGDGSIDAPLAKAMRRETELFFANVIREDRSVLEFLDADYTFLNELLAKHYGITGVVGESMRRVSLSRSSQRGGLLTQATLHVSTSSAAETHLVLRGKWVLENLLGSSPIRPPLAVLEALQNTPKHSTSGTMRQQLELHRTNSGCAECHVRMDGIGLALENYGPTGAWRRSNLRGLPIETTGAVLDGETINGPIDLRAYLVKNHRLFVRTLSERLLVHALGRKLTDDDRAALDPIPNRAAANGFRFSHILLEVIQSEPFLAIGGIRNSLPARE